MVQTRVHIDNEFTITLVWSLALANSRVLSFRPIDFFRHGAGGALRMEVESGV